MENTAALGIMCKAPRPGGTKTRLGALIGAVSAAKLSECFLRDVAAAIEEIPVAVGRKGYAVYAPAGAEPELRRILPSSFNLLMKVDTRFENVLYGATQDLLALGHDCVVLINGDSPTLPPRYLRDAIDALRRPGDRMVLGPAADGGFYLIGLKFPHDHVFSDIPWGTDVVTQRTLQRAREIGLESLCLPEWYDVDDAESLAWLREELAGRSDRFRNGGTADATRSHLVAMPIAGQ
jgi:rSAM/selenodomain-associated transferase 1